MARRPTVLLDCDGVLADFVGGFLRIVNHHFGTTITRDRIKEFDIERALGWDAETAKEAYSLITRSPRLASMLDVLPGAVDGVRRLREFADVYVVTSPWWSNPTWMHDRTNWLHEHFGILATRVIHTSAKHLVRGDMLIDDKTSTCEQWQAAWPDGLAVQWETPHNLLDEWDGARADSWNELIVLAGSLS